MKQYRAVFYHVGSINTTDVTATDPVQACVLVRGLLPDGAALLEMWELLHVNAWAVTAGGES